MKKINLLWIIALILIIPIVQAVTPDFTFKNDGNASLSLPCYYNGTWCSAGATCNITILTSNNYIIFNNEPMNRVGSLFNVSIQNITQNGIYKASMVCYDQGLSGFYDFYFKINPLGSDDTTGNNLITVFLIILFILFMISLYLAITIKTKTEYSDDGSILKINYLKYIKIASIFTSWLSAWGFSFFLWQSSINYTQFEGLTGFLRSMFILITALGIPIFIITIILLLVSIVYNRELKKMMERGLKRR